MNDHTLTTSSALAEQYEKIPSDFPTDGLLGAVTGAHPKLLLTEFDGKFYQQGTCPPERFQRWDVCKDLARQFSEKCLESKAGKRSHMSEVEILRQYFDRLLKTGWVSEAEGVWIIHRVAAVLSWPSLAF